jgi:hypothetical protein
MAWTAGIGLTVQAGLCQQRMIVHLSQRIVAYYYLVIAVTNSKVASPCSTDMTCMANQYHEHVEALMAVTTVTTLDF